MVENRNEKKGPTVTQTITPWKMGRTGGMSVVMERDLEQRAEVCLGEMNFKMMSEHPRCLRLAGGVEDKATEVNLRVMSREVVPETAEVNEVA